MDSSNPADELLEGFQYSRSVNLFGFDQILAPSLSDHTLVNRLEFGDPNPNHPSQTNLSEENNVSQDVLNYISQMLMEDDDEDWENLPCLIQDSLALQAAEKSLYDALHNPPSSIRENTESPDDDFTRTSSSLNGFNSSACVDNFVDSSSIGYRYTPGFCRVDHNSDNVVQSDTISFGSSSVFPGTVDSLVSSFQVLDPSKVDQPSSRFTIVFPAEEHENYILEQSGKNPWLLAEAENNLGEQLIGRSRGTKNHYDEDFDYLEVGRSYKQLASYDRDSDEPSGMYEVLLCPAMNPHLHEEESSPSIVIKPHKMDWVGSCRRKCCQKDQVEERHVVRNKAAEGKWLI